MKRHPITLTLGGLVLAATLAVACSEAPAGVPPHPAFAETIAQSVTVPTQPFTGLCPEGFDLIWIPFLPASRQAEAMEVDGRHFDRGDVIDLKPGWFDGYVCIKKPPPDDPDKQPLRDNALPLDQ